MDGRHAWIAGSVTIAALTFGGLSGCTGSAATAPALGPDPTTTSTPSNPTPTTTTGVLDDTARARIPQPARAHTPAGAEAFARFYLEQVNKAWMAPDPDLIRPYASESCKTCANYVATASWLDEKHFHYDRPPSTVGVSVVLPESELNRALIQIVNNQEKANVVESDGSIHQPMPHIYAGSEVDLHWNDDSWKIYGVKAAL